MGDGAQVATALAGRRWMVVLSAAVIAGVVLYYGFLALDTWGLEAQQGVARVVAKEYREPGATYATQKVGDRMLTLPQTTPAMYVLTLDLSGVEAEAAVDKAVYDAVSEGQELRVVYTTSRLRRHLQILQSLTR